MQAVSILGIISYKVWPAQMGGQKCAAGFYEYLSKQCEVTVLVSRENQQKDIPLKHAESFLFNHWWGPLNIIWLPSMLLLIKKRKITHIIIEHSYLGWLGWLLSKLSGKPLIVRSHNIESQRLRDRAEVWWGLYAWYERWVLRHVAHNFFVTEEDMQWAIAKWKIKADKASIASFGVTQQQPPSGDEKHGCRKFLETAHDIAPEEKVFLFNGTLDYLPNVDAIRIIISELVPRLNKYLNFRYCILICGNKLSEPWQRVLEEYENVIYAGFVDDIDIYYEGADCFIVPSSLGTGIKTKLIEALANNQMIISTHNGIKGLKTEHYLHKLIAVPDYDWDAFAEAMVNLPEKSLLKTPEAFFETFHWERITQQALAQLQKI